MGAQRHERAGVRAAGRHQVRDARRLAGPAAAAAGAGGAAGPDGEPPAPALQFFEAEVEAPPSGEAGPGLVIELPGGGRARVSAGEQVPWMAQLLRLLAQTGGRPC